MVLDGSTAQIGTCDHLILEAVNCANGDSPAGTEAQASDRAMSSTRCETVSCGDAKKPRGMLSTVQKYTYPGTSDYAISRSRPGVHSRLAGP